MTSKGGCADDVDDVVMDDVTGDVNDVVEYGNELN